MSTSKRHALEKALSEFIKSTQDCERELKFQLKKSQLETVLYQTLLKEQSSGPERTLYVLIETQNYCGYPSEYVRGVFTKKSKALKEMLARLSPKLEFTIERSFPGAEFDVSEGTTVWASFEESYDGSVCRFIGIYFVNLTIGNYLEPFEVQ